MKHLIVAAGLGLGLVGSAIAGPLTQGIEFTGGENSLAGLVAATRAKYCCRRWHFEATGPLSITRRN